MGLVAILGVAAIGGVSLVSSNVFASLNATAFNTTAQNISVGTLKLTQANATSPASGGITTAIGPIQPGDRVNRYVDLTNGGSLAASAMTLQIADAQAAASVTAISAAAGTVTYTAVNSFVAGQTVTITGATAPAYNLVNATIASASGTQFTVTSAATGATSTATATPLSTLTSDPTNGLKVTVSACAVAWSGGLCSGGSGLPVLSQTAASLLKAGAQTLTPGNLVLAAGGLTRLQISMFLPATLSETTTNGALPATTLQGAVGSITWTFTEAQVTGGVTNS